jgi:ribosomal protein L24E
MLRPLFSLFLALSLAGCASNVLDTGLESGPVAPSRELAKLSLMLGEWTGEGRLVSPSAEVLRAAMPPGQEPMTTFESGSTTEFALGGKFLRSQGWHEVGAGRISRYVQFVTWDPRRGKYRSWYFTDSGEIGEGWMTVEADGRTFRSQAGGTRADGSPIQGRGVATVVEDGSMQWSWSEKGPAGEIELEGRSRRKQGR